MKTSELQGAALDWAVAKCKGETVSMVLGKLETLWTENGYSPSTDWSQGGPIIERELIAVWFSKGYWKSQMRDTSAKTHGPTPLIAAMRCYVASKLGEYVDVPEELV